MRIGSDYFEVHRLSDGTEVRLRLLRAYSKIKDQTVQRQLVSLMESIAANED